MTHDSRFWRRRAPCHSARRDNDAVTMRLLVWPESSTIGEPLEPKEPGWVVGWTLDDGTVVCADIVPQDANVVVDKNLVVGQWIPTAGEDGASKKSSIPSFVSTKDGPWWKHEEADSAPAQQQLLLYRRGVFYQHETSPAWSLPLFSKLLRYINQAKNILDCANEEKAVPNVDNASDGSRPAKEEVVKVEDKEQSASLLGRFRRFVAKQSMLVLHGRSIEGILLQIPVIQSCLLIRGVKSKLAHDGNQVSEYTKQFNQMVSVALNTILGVLMGVLFFYQTDEILNFLEYAWRVCYEELLRDNIQWLETFPAGFKLNVVLTQNMGREITMLIGVHDSVCNMLWAIIPKQFILRAVGVVSVVFGFTAFIALLHDILILSTLHIATVATCFRAMHRTQLYLLASLWRLFRGKKKNILRHRTDTMEEDSMQLLVGMILFTAVLFLFTTILVYYAFFAVLHLAIQIVGVGLWCLYTTVRYLPLGTVLLRARHSEWFTERVYLEEIPSKSRTITRLCPIYRSYAFIFLDPFSKHFTAVISATPRYILQVLTGKPCTIREVCLASISTSSG